VKTGGSDFDLSIEANDVSQKESANVKLVNILNEHRVLFNKSQVPKVKERKEAALKEVYVTNRSKH
jgi:hypothetical protein